MRACTTTYTTKHFTDTLSEFYVTGWTTSPDFPAWRLESETPRFQGSYAGGGGDAFAVAVRFATNYEQLGSYPQIKSIYATYLGGSGDDEGNAITADRYRNFYVAGTTPSRDFPVGDDPAQEVMKGHYDGFVTRFEITRY